MGAEVPLTRRAIRLAQGEALRSLLTAIVPGNTFQTRRLAAVRKDLMSMTSLEEFVRLVPLTTKTELVDDQAVTPPYGTNLTFPLARYTRCHQTSGTSGVPLRWLDTPESWNALVDVWTGVHRAAGVTAEDRIFFAFSFGPFIGFWLAFEAGQRLGALCLPGGGLSSPSRLHAILDHQATVLCCTPTYALHLAETSSMEGLSLARSRVRTIIVAGEPGGSIPTTRRRIEEVWSGARVFDHHGMTEVGPVTYECPAEPGVLHIAELAFLAEVIDPATTRPVRPGERGELVLTTLHRTGSPLLRFRTGDLVRPRQLPEDEGAPCCACGQASLALEGGILGRVDDMLIVRGVNLYPGAVEAILRGFSDIAEYQVVVTQPEGLTDVTVRIEPVQDYADPAGLARRVAAAFQVALALRLRVIPVPAGGLPRFEFKAQRWLRR